MSKSRITAAVVAMALVGMPVILGSSAAFAATSTGTTDSNPAPSFSAADRDEDEDEDEDTYEHNHGVLPPVVIRPHQEGDEYGEDEDEDGDEDDEYGDDDEGAGTLPPLPSVTPSPGSSIDPSNANGFGPAYNKRGEFVVAPLGAPGSGGGPRGGTPVSAIDPQSAPAISMQGVKTSAKTPSQIFVESATVGLTAMGVGAIALGGIAGVRAIRLRKNPLGDYFYETEK